MPVTTGQEKKKDQSTIVKSPIGQENNFWRTLIGATFSLSFYHNVGGGTITAWVRQKQEHVGEEPNYHPSTNSRNHHVFHPNVLPKRNHGVAERKSGIPPGMAKQRRESETSPFHGDQGKREGEYHHRKFCYEKDPSKILRNSTTTTWNRWP